MTVHTLAEDLYFGTEAQIAVTRRAMALAQIVRDDPRYCFAARAVSLTQPLASVEATIWNQVHGAGTALEASRAFLAGYRPPDGLRLSAVPPDAPALLLARIAACWVRSGVAPCAGSILRGQGLRCFVMYVADPDGQVVAVGGSAMAYHAGSPRKTEAFWGMLATDEAWRGHRLACWIGAAAIQRASDRFGATGFSSGVKPDNPASMAMCQRLGITPSDYADVGATDPVVLGEASITR